MTKPPPILHGSRYAAHTIYRHLFADENAKLPTFAAKMWDPTAAHKMQSLAGVRLTPQAQIFPNKTRYFP